MVFKRNNPGCSNNLACRCGCCGYLDDIRLNGTTFSVTTTGGHCGYDGTYGTAFPPSRQSVPLVSPTYCQFTLGGYVGTTGTGGVTITVRVLALEDPSAAKPGGVTGELWVDFIFSASRTLRYQRATCDSGPLTYVGASGTTPLCATPATTISIALA